MNIPLLGLRTTIYKVNDISNAKAWYSNVLGFEPYFDQPFYVGYNVQGYELGLLPYEIEHDSDNILSYWGVEDIFSAYNKLLQEGAISHEEPTNVGENIYVASVKDPFGNAFGIIQNPHFKLNNQ